MLFMVTGVVSCTSTKEGLLDTTKLHYKVVTTNQSPGPFSSDMEQLYSKNVAICKFSLLTM